MRQSSFFKLLLFSTMCWTGDIFAQNVSRIELLHADVSEFDQSLNAKATRLIGNVAFRHQDAVMTCDSAYLYREENRLEAYHSVRINKNDTITLTGDRLDYDGNTRLAKVYDHVVMKDRRMTLRTSRINYDMNTEIANYTDSANIVDAENTLTSRIGYFYSRTHDLFFRKEVLLVNPKYRMNSDTLRFNTITNTATFLGPTWIRSKENTIYCESGWYNTDKQTSSFYKNSSLVTKNQILKGDSVWYDRQKGIGKVFGNVSINDTANKVIISGDYGEHHENSDSSWVTGHALMTQIYDADSMFLHADTLLAIPAPGMKHDTSETKRDLFAFHRVKIFKNDLQGVCDSLAYNYRDSTIRLFYDPVLWSGSNQLTADSVTLFTWDSEIRKIYMVNNSFISSRADSLQKGILDSIQFNQVRGKTMTGYFDKNKLYRIDVNGNGQTIYYAQNKKKRNFAVNRAECSDMMILVNDSKVKQITLINEPDGTMYPIHELKTSELRLKGFSWRSEQRPADKAAILK